MRPESLIVAGAVLVLTTLPATAQDVELAALFPQRAEVELASGERQRLFELALPVPVLEHSSQGLADLRLLDDAGSEIPFLVLGRRTDAPSQVVQTEAAEILSVEQEQDPRDGAPALRRERYVLSAPDLSSRAAQELEGEPWWLVIEVATARFVRELTIGEPRGAGSRPLLSDESLFRLGGESERTRFLLPAFEGRLEVSITGEGEAFLDPRFRYERRRDLPVVRAEDDDEDDRDVEVELPIASFETSDLVTVLRLERPGALLLDAVELVTSTPALRRRIEVYDRFPDGDRRLLGSALITRAPSRDPLERLSVPLEPPRGSHLEVRVFDQDSPALEEVRVVGHLRRPALVFAPPLSGSRLWLYFGGGRTERPSYDLAALLLSPPAHGESAQLAARLLDSGQLMSARLGDVLPNPRFDPSPVLAFAMRPGADLDAKVYSHLRPLVVGETRTGLSAVTMVPLDLGIARADLADLRIADEEGRQWPYLLRRGAREELVTLALAADRAGATERGISRYRLEAAAEPLPAVALELEVAAPFFDRPFVLSGRRQGDDDPRPLRDGRLVRRQGESGTLVIALEPSGERVEELILRVEDGDERPLEIATARLRVPVPELRFPAPPGHYQLLLGFPDDRAPRYDLERIRPVVLALDAEAASLGALETNSAFSLASRMGRGAGAQRLLLISAVVIAVLGLAALTLRLVQQGESSGQE
jgi:hypothetical protein